MTGYDISPKLIKLDAESFAGPIAKLVNRSIETFTFPERADVTPAFKQNDIFHTAVNILPSMSKRSLNGL